MRILLETQCLREVFIGHDQGHHQGVYQSKYTCSLSRQLWNPLDDDSLVQNHRDTFCSFADKAAA